MDVVTDCSVAVFQRVRGVCEEFQDSPLGAGRRRLHGAQRGAMLVSSERTVRPDGN